MVPHKGSTRAIIFSL